MPASNLTERGRIHPSYRSNNVQNVQLFFEFAFRSFKKLLIPFEALSSTNYPPEQPTHARLRYNYAIHQVIFYISYHCFSLQLLKYTAIFAI